MAKTTYKVKQEDSFATLGKDVMKLNPGVTSLSTGQVIYVPKPKPKLAEDRFAGANLGAGAINTTPSQTNLGTYNNSPYVGFQTPTSTTQFASTTTPATPATPAGKKIARGNNGGGNTQTNYPAASYMSPVAASLAPAVTQPAVIPRPQGIYTGSNSASDQQWRDYWNWRAANPSQAYAQDEASAAAAGLPSPSAVHIPTRDEIWQMKAEQRRKREIDNGNTTGYGTFQPFQPASPVAFQNYGNAVNTALNWRV